jgi:hypothetical protein
MKKTILLLIITLCSVISIKAQTISCISPSSHFYVYNETISKWESATTEVYKFIGINISKTTVTITDPAGTFEYLNGSSITRADGSISWNAIEISTGHKCVFTMYIESHRISRSFEYGGKYYDRQYYYEKLQTEN